MTVPSLEAAARVDPSTIVGLTEEDAARRLAADGPNELPTAKPRNLLQQATRRAARADAAAPGRRRRLVLPARRAARRRHPDVVRRRGDRHLAVPGAQDRERAHCTARPLLASRARHPRRAAAADRRPRRRPGRRRAPHRRRSRSRRRRADRLRRTSRSTKPRSPGRPSLSARRPHAPTPPRRRWARRVATPHPGCSPARSWSRAAASRLSATRARTRRSVASGTRCATSNRRARRCSANSPASFGSSPSAASSPRRSSSLVYGLTRHDWLEGLLVAHRRRHGDAARGDPGRPHRLPGARRLAHVPTSRPHPPLRRHRDPRIRHRDLRRQDRHADAQLDGCRLIDGRRLRPRRRRPRAPGAVPRARRVRRARLAARPVRPDGPRLPAVRRAVPRRHRTPPHRHGISSASTRCPKTCWRSPTCGAHRTDPTTSSPPRAPRKRSPISATFPPPERAALDTQVETAAQRRTPGPRRRPRQVHRDRTRCRPSSTTSTSSTSASSASTTPCDPTPPTPSPAATAPASGS